MDRWCERMPMTTHSNTERWYWPATFTAKDIHEKYAKEMDARGLPSFKYDAFNKLITTAFPHCRRASNSTEFKCSECLQLTERAKYYTSINGDGTWTRVVQQAIVDKAVHMELNMEQRLKKEKHAEKASLYPEKYGFLIADGMDQQKLWQPNPGTRKDFWQDHGASFCSN
jgi:hypothetical protein